MNHKTKSLEIWKGLAKPTALPDSNDTFRGPASASGSDMLEAGSDMLEAGSDMLEAGSDMLEAGSDMLEAGSDMLEAGSDMLEAGSDVVLGGPTVTVQSTNRFIQWSPVQHEVACMTEIVECPATFGTVAGRTHWKIWLSKI
jgi:hypothetical protein